MSTPISSRPKHYMVLLFPGFQLLDAAGPLDILRTATYNPGGDANLTLTLVGETNEPVSTAPIPPPSQNNQWHIQSDPALPDGPNGRVLSTFNPRFAVDATYQDVLDNPEKWPVDVLLIPGGIGERMTRIYNEYEGQDKEKLTENGEPAKAFIKAVAPRVNNAILTVCTGSDLLAQTGLLEGRRATTNMTAFKTVTTRKGPSQKVNWIKGARWVKAGPPSEVTDGEGVSIHIWSSAGISAGMDLMLAFLSEVYSTPFARTIAKRLEYEWLELGDGDVDPMYYREDMMGTN